MFKEIISKLRSITRFDSVMSTKDLKIGEVSDDKGGSRLAIQLPSSEVVTLEERAMAQLGANWGIPAAHLERLPNELAAEELLHFARSSPRDITVRTVREPGQAYPAARAVLSGKYQPFDNDAVLETVEPYLEGFRVSHSSIERDEMRLLATQEHTSFDVSPRKVGDVTKAGLLISNSEIGTMALRVEFSLLRLVCTNGMTASDFEAARVRHIYVDRPDFVAKLRECVARAGQVGEQIARRLQATHALALPNLDPDQGKLQREVVSILRRENLYTQAFATEAEQALIDSGELSLFSLVQYLTDNRRLSSARLADRVHSERVAGRLIALAS